MLHFVNPHLQYPAAAGTKQSKKKKKRRNKGMLLARGTSHSIGMFKYNL